MKFDVNYVLWKTPLSQYFYEGLKPLIKLWIDEDSRELLARDNLVKKLSRVEAKAKIQNNRDLNQRCYWDKWPLKLMKKARNNQPEKVPKSGTAS